MIRLSVGICPGKIRSRARGLEDNRPAQSHRVRKYFVHRFIKHFRCPFRSLKIILNILQEEWDSTTPLGTSPLHRNLQRIRLGLSPLLFIESNIMQLISPGSENCRDVSVRPGSNWKALLKARADNPVSGPAGGRRSQNPLNKETDPTAVLAASKDDILILWQDPSVQVVLKKRNVRIEDMPGL